MNVIKYLIRSFTTKSLSSNLTLQYWQITKSEPITTLHSNLKNYTELCVPELQLCINNQKNKVNIGICSNQQYNLESELKIVTKKLIKSVQIKNDSEMGKSLMLLAYVYKNIKQYKVI
jgi:hypothetical protein